MKRNRRKNRMSESEMEGVAYFLFVAIYEEEYKSLAMLIEQAQALHKSRLPKQNILLLDEANSTLSIRRAAQEFFAQLHADAFNLKISENLLAVPKRDDWIRHLGTAGRQHKIAWTFLIEKIHERKLQKNFRLSPELIEKWGFASRKELAELKETLRFLRSKAFPKEAKSEH